jgi:hypothetical protein
VLADNELAGSALRVLGLAYRELPEGSYTDDDALAESSPSWASWA